MTKQDTRTETPFERDYRKTGEEFAKYLHDIPFRRSKSWRKNGRPSRFLSTVFNLVAPPKPLFTLPGNLSAAHTSDKDAQLSYEVMSWLDLLGIKQSVDKLLDGKSVQDIFDGITDKHNALHATGGLGKGEKVTGLDKFAVRSPEAAHDGRTAFFDDVLALVNAAEDLENRINAKRAEDKSGEYVMEEGIARNSYMDWLRRVVTEARDTGAAPEDIRPRPLNATREWKLKKYARSATP